MTEYVYIIKDNGYKNRCKIGISKNPKQRLKNLQTGNSNKLELIFALQVESNIKSSAVESVIHKYFKGKNLWILGEWFEFQNDDQIVNLAQTMLSIGENCTSNFNKKKKKT
jgi:hypothetical protein